ncbi:hypothetical protein QM646_46040, partial [Rhodococcus erythropolis]|nr:hypothetical protein [Rhodococcus erythropolis]
SLADLGIQLPPLTSVPKVPIASVTTGESTSTQGPEAGTAGVVAGTDSLAGVPDCGGGELVTVVPDSFAVEVADAVELDAVELAAASGVPSVDPQPATIRAVAVTS